MRKQDPKKVTFKNKSKKFSGDKGAKKVKTYTYGGESYDLDSKEVRDFIKARKEEQKKRRDSLRASRVRNKK